MKCFGSGADSSLLSRDNIWVQLLEALESWQLVEQKPDFDFKRGWISIRLVVGECQKGVGRSEAGAFHAHGASHTWARLRLGRLFQAACIWISGKTTPRGGGQRPTRILDLETWDWKKDIFFLTQIMKFWFQFPKRKITYYFKIIREIKRHFFVKISASNKFHLWKFSRAFSQSRFSFLSQSARQKGRNSCFHLKR